MKQQLFNTGSGKRRVSAFTLVEVIMAIGLIAFVFGGIIVAYTQATRRAEWSGYSLAAQALAVQQLEQARSAMWDPTFQGGKNDLTNLSAWPTSRVSTGGWSTNGGAGYQWWSVSGYSWTNLDIPIAGTNNLVRATNYWTVRSVFAVYSNQIFYPSPIQIVKVDTVWPFTKGKTTKLFTNSLSSYFAPDNRDYSSL